MFEENNLPTAEPGNTVQPTPPVEQSPAEVKIESIHPESTLEEFDAQLDAAKKVIIAQSEQTETPAPANPEGGEPEKKEVPAGTEAKPQETETTSAASTDANDTNQPPANPEGEKIVRSDNVIVNEAYILSQPVETQEILRSVLGKRESFDADAKILKNYVNAQQKIKQDALALEDLKQGKNQASRDIQLKDEQQDFVRTIAVQKLKEHFPDVPETEEEMKAYLRDLNVDDPEAARNFIETKRKSFELAENQVKQAVYQKENEDVLAKQNISAGKDMFVQVANMFGVENAEKILVDNGLDFSNTETEEGKKALISLVKENNPLVGSPIIKIGGNGNPNDFADKTATYTVDGRSLALRAVLRTLPILIQEKTKAAEKAGFEKGLNSRVNKEQLNIPSLSNGALGNRSVQAPTRTTNIDENLDDLGTMEQKLAEMKKSVLQAYNSP